MNPAKLREILRDEVAAIHPRLILMKVRSRFASGALRGLYFAQLLRRAGFTLGARTTVLGLPRITGSDAPSHAPHGAILYDKLQIGDDVVLDTGIVLDLEARITIGNRVLVGPEVMILTSTHELGPRERRAGEIICSPVIIEDGVWIGARSVILPGVTIGAGAVVNPGAVVNKDVPANTRVSGTPAKKVESFEPVE